MMKRAMSALLVALLLAGVLAGCRQPGGESSGAPSSSSQPGEEAPEESSSSSGEEQPAQTGDVVVPKDPQGFVVYLFKRGAMTGGEVYLPLERPVQGALDARALADLLCDKGVFLYPLEFTLAVEEQTAVVNLTMDPDNPYVDGAQLRSLWATLVQGTQIKQVRFLADGRPYTAPDFETEADGLWPGEEIRLPDQTREELAALRESIPYQPPQLFGGEPDPEMDYPVLDDPTARMLANFIKDVTMWNMPGESFSRMEDAPEQFVVMAAMRNSPYFSWSEWNAGSQEYRPQLAPLAQSSGDTEGYLQEHVERTAELLFGQGVQLKHQRLSPWGYNAYSGVYTPPHMGIYGFIMPVVLDYQELDDRYQVEAAFISYYMGMDYMDLFGGVLPREQAAEYCKTVLPRHSITLDKTEGGGLCYTAHQLPDPAYEVNYAALDLPKDKINAEVLLSVVKAGSGQLPQLDYAPRQEEFVYGEGGEAYLVVPTYTGTTLRIEEQDGAGGAPRVLYQAEAHDQYALALHTPPGTRLRLVAEYGGREAAYILGDAQDGPVIVLDNWG